MGRQIGTKEVRSRLLLLPGLGLNPSEAKTMKTGRTLLIVGCIYGLLSGCSAPYYIVLINGLEETLSVRVKGSIYAIDPGAFQEILFDESASMAQFRVAGKAYIYDWKYPPRGFVEQTGVRKGFVVLIGKDLDAYLTQRSRNQKVCARFEPTPHRLQPARTLLG